MDIEPRADQETLHGPVPRQTCLKSIVCLQWCCDRFVRLFCLFSVTVDRFGLLVDLVKGRGLGLWNARPRIELKTAFSDQVLGSVWPWRPWILQSFFQVEEKWHEHQQQLQKRGEFLADYLGNIPGKILCVEVMTDRIRIIVEQLEAECK